MPPDIRHAPETAKTAPEDEPPAVFAKHRARKARTAEPVGTAAVAAPAGVRTLCIDVGGTGLKALIIDARGTPQGPRVRVGTPRPATPAAVLAALHKMLAPMGSFDRVSVGFPGVVTRGITRTAPNLDGDWTNFHLAEKLGKAIGKPVRVLNDAGVQGFGVIEGKGVEMVLTLGTGMGCALFVDGRYVPNLELSHHPFKGHKTYEDYVSAQAREKLGNKKWNKHVERVIEQVIPIFNPDRIYLGGGNSKHLHLKLPPHVKITPNEAGLLGGLALWND
jgi:polyphosphate glucokinase